MAFDIEKMHERAYSTPYFLFCSICAHWALGMSVEERRKAISGCNQKIAEINKEIEELEQGRMFGELDEEEVKPDIEMHTSLDIYETMHRAMMIPEIVLAETKELLRSGDFDYEED